MKLTDPDIYALYEESVNCPELDRIIENMRRHKARGVYDRDRALHSVMRFVVEPCAIQINGGGKKWWERYPVTTRSYVADMVLKGWEREL
jgi:hypothetical protein